MPASSSPFLSGSTVVNVNAVVFASHTLVDGTCFRCKASGSGLLQSCVPVPEPCPGCGMAWFINTVNPMQPHNPIECAAYKRGFEDGKRASKNNE